MRKVHLCVSRCSIHSPKSILRAGHRAVNEEPPKRAIDGCICNGISHRVARPKLTGWSSKFGGEIIGIDVTYPFAGVRSGIPGKLLHALIAECLSRFAICPLAKDTKADALTTTLLSDRIPPIGEPRGIIPDNVPPGMIGVEWVELSHTYCIHRARARKKPLDKTAWSMESFGHSRLRSNNCFSA